MEVDSCLPTDIFDDDLRGRMSPNFLQFDEDLFPPSVSGSEDMASTDELLNCIINSPSGSDSSGSDSLFQSNGFNTSEELLNYALLNSPASSDTSADSLLSPSMFDIENLTMSVTGSSVNCENSDATFPMEFDWASTIQATDLSVLAENSVTTISSESLQGLSVTPVLSTSIPQTSQQIVMTQSNTMATVAQTTPATLATPATTLSTFLIVKSPQVKPTLTVAPTKTIFVTTPSVKTAESRSAPTTVAEPTKGVLLELTEEEKRLLKEEGSSLPTDVPLTKAEQKTLKKIRRKIKNKQSAQESRRKKKEYIDGLERRVKICTEQNLGLQKKVEDLEKSNRTLLDELKRLQTMVTSTNPTKAQAGTCLMVVVLAFALVLAPLSNNFGSSDKTVPTVKSQSAYSTVSVRSRTLLQINEDVDSSHLDGGNNVPNISEYLKGLTFSLGLTKGGGIEEAKSANFVDSHIHGDNSYLERKDTYSRLEYV